MIPDTDRCFRLMEDYHMLPNIRQHSLVVARVAWVLAAGLGAGAPPLVAVPNQELVVAGALLHDIAKTQCLRSGGDHARAGASICEGLGYPEIATIVAEHVLLPDHDPAQWADGHFTASEIINYADKRVRHEEIVSLEERLVYILDRYSGGDPDREQRIRDNFVRCRQLESSLFSFLPFSPGQLHRKVLAQREGGPAGLFAAPSREGFTDPLPADVRPSCRGFGP